jgi:hypothetical protein
MELAGLEPATSRARFAKPVQAVSEPRWARRSGQSRCVARPPKTFLPRRARTQESNDDASLLPPNVNANRGGDAVPSDLANAPSSAGPTFLVHARVRLPDLALARATRRSRTVMGLTIRRPNLRRLSEVGRKDTRAGERADRRTNINQSNDYPARDCI